MVVLAITRPAEALVIAQKFLAGGPASYEASFAHQTVGIVLRDRGDMSAGTGAMRRAVDLAVRSGRIDRQVDVRATLGMTLVWSGRARAGLESLNWAVAHARGGAAGRVLMRRAAALYSLGRHEEALADLVRGVPILRRVGDDVWVARSLNLRSDVYLALGRSTRAAADIAQAERMAAGDGLEYAISRHNLGLIAMASGNLPQALTYFDEARERFEAAAEALRPDHVLDRSAALLAAGLAEEAFDEADAAAGLLTGPRSNSAKLAELLLAAAVAALAAGRATDAQERATRASQLFRRHGRAWWQARAEFIRVQAAYADGDRSTRLRSRAEQAAQQLDEFGVEDATRAHLLVGRLALDAGLRGAADSHFARAARNRTSGPPLARSVAWLARALQAESRFDTRGTTLACARGLDALDEHRLTLGATELRAYATAHGGELAAIAQRQALARGDARRLLVWSERWRATALSVPPQRPPDDHELVEELAALRAIVHRLETIHAAGGTTTVLERERRRLEGSVSARTRRALGAGHAPAERFDLDELTAELGETTRLVELVEVDDLLHAVVVAGSAARHHVVGPVSDAIQEVEMARFALRRLAAGRATRQPVDLVSAGTLLEKALLGPAAAELGDLPVVIVPPGRLHAVPWALLPALRERVVAVAPSATIWLRARRSQAPAHRRVALVVGPGLDTGGAEVPVLAQAYPSATVLGNGSATADQVLGALDGAWLGHIAAHGEFRADNPLFSALTMDDGPLTVHDFERLRRAPYRLVLSACDSGVAAPVGADELLGLASSLVPLGAAGILASIVRVNDEATVPLMLEVHEALRRGATLAEALLTARMALAGDPVADATGASFVALGH